MRAKAIAHKLSAIVDISSVGTNWIAFSSSTALVVGDEITAKAIEIEQMLPDGWELEIGRISHRIRKCATITRYGRGF